MIKTGIYGLLRTFTFLGEAPSWWGWTLVAIGAVSGILGVLFALAQHDLKRLLAYHSVENIGIIALGMGVGLLGLAHHLPVMAFLGFSGAMLHVLNHALFKSLLFLGAGAVQHSTGTRDIDRLGGLLKKMPVTGATFLVGACAISGLPPLNGFVSELLIYLGVLTGVADPSRVAGVGWALLCVLVVGGLALIGGLAAACFTKAFGCVFLGEPRSEPAKRGHEVGAGDAHVDGPAGRRMLRRRLDGAGVARRLPSGRRRDRPDPLPRCRPGRCRAGVGSAGRRLRLVLGPPGDRRSSGNRSPTIAGRSAGPARAHLGLRLCRSHAAHAVHGVLVRRAAVAPVSNVAAIANPILIRRPASFPRMRAWNRKPPTSSRNRSSDASSSAIAWTASKLRWLQHGRIQLYVLYIALTILVLLVWKLG